MKPRQRRSISDEEFVIAWMESSGVSEVASKLGLSSAAAYQRATVMRKVGVKLKKFARQKKDIDIDALNRIVERISKKR